MKAGQPVSVSIGGRGASYTKSANTTLPFAIGAAFTGLVAIGTGVWWWRRPDEADEEIGEQPDAEMDFDQTINEIAHLDEAYEKGDIDEREYHESREALRKEAKALLEQKDREN